MKRILLSVLAIFLFLNSYGQTSNRILIKNVNIIPLHINKLLEGKNVVIENGKIIAIKDAKSAGSETYDQTIDGTGKYLTAAFTDAHVHLPEQENLEKFFLMNLVNGVTTLRSMRGELWHLEIDKNAPLTPNLMLSAPPIMHTEEFTKESAFERIKGYKDQGFDFVKFFSIRSQESFNAVISAAISNRFMLAGHCPQNVGIFNITSRPKIFRSVEHLGGVMQLTEEADIIKAIQQTNEKEIYQCPTMDWYYTLLTPKSKLEKRAGLEYMPQSMIDGWNQEAAMVESKGGAKSSADQQAAQQKQLQKRKNRLRQIYELGALLLVSPDASGAYGIPGYGMHTEMQHFADAGIDNLDILKAASYNFAKMNNEQATKGSVKIGVTGDLVLLNANPLDNIANTKTVEGIVFKGKYYTAAELKKKL